MHLKCLPNGKEIPGFNLLYEIVISLKGCTLTMHEHGYGNGISHTFTNDGSSQSSSDENKDLAIVGLANNVSSYQCQCP